MEMTECGKHGKPRSRRSTLPTLLGNPFGIATFPPPRLLAYFKMREHERPNPRPLDLKGVVMEVLGPKCNGCSGTLTPLSELLWLLLFLAESVAGRAHRPAEARGADLRLIHPNWSPEHLGDMGKWSVQSAQGDPAMSGYDSAQKLKKDDDLGRWRFASEIASVIRSTPAD